MQAVSDRIYPIQSSSYWYAGHTRDGRQVLYGLLCPSLVAYFFSERGDLIDVQQQHLEFLEEGRNPGHVYDIYDPRIEPRREAWSRQLGIYSGTIRVRKFRDSNHGVEILDYPDCFDDALQRPNASSEVKARIAEFRRDWEQQRNFVLLWGEDYWMDEEGQIESS